MVAAFNWNPWSGSSESAHRACVSFFGCYLVHALQCELEIVTLLPIEDRQDVPARLLGQTIPFGSGRK
jgi:hypothetical protein